MFSVLQFFKSSKRNSFLILIAFLIGIFDFVGFGLFLPLLENLSNNNEITMLKIDFLDQYFEQYSLKYSVVYIIALIVVTLFLKTLVILLYFKAVAATAFDYINDLKISIYKNFLVSIYDNKNNQVGRIVNALTQQGNMAVGAIYICYQLLQQITIVFACFFLSLMVSWKLFTIAVLISVFLFLSFKKSFSLTKSLSVKVASLNENLSSVIIIISKNLLYLKAVNCGFQFQNKLEYFFKSLKKSTVLMAVLKKVPTVTSEPISALLFGVVIFIGLELGLEFSVILFQAFMLHRVFSKCMPLIGLYQDFRSQLVSLEYCLDLYNDTGALDKENNHGIEFLTLNDSIEFRDVTLGYGKKDVLKNLNLTFRRGELTLILGKSGIGKSTIVKGILGIIKPSDGSIYFDGIQQNEYSINTIRNKLGYLTQEPIMFPGSLRDNLSFRVTSLNEQEVIDDIKQFNLEGLFTNHKIDLNYKFDENSSNISGGQKQRLALMRELIAKPDIIILDEPTSSLDNDSKDNILKYLNLIRNNRTIIIISHDEDLVEVADNIIQL